MTIPQRSKSLDYLRVFASTWVLFYHLADPSQVQLLFNTAFTKYIFSNGWYGVEIFFLLSAFLIGSQLQYLNVSKFLKRRTTRLLPGLTIGLALSLLIAKVGGVPGHSQSFPRPIASYLASVVLLYQHFDVKPASNTLWSLIIEVRYYALASIYLVIRRINPFRHRSILPLIAIYLVLMLVDQTFSNIRGLIHLDLSLDRAANDNGFLPIFILGTITGYYRLTFKTTWGLELKLVTSLCWFLIFIYHDASNLLIGVLSLSWILLLRCNRTNLNSESGQFLRALSDATFITYLIHLELGDLVLFKLKQFGLFQPYFSLLITILVVVNTSLFISYLFERPSRNKLQSLLK